MTLRYIFNQDQLVADFVARAKVASGFSRRAGFTDANLKAIGIVNADNELIAGIVYFNYNPEAGTDRDEHRGAAEAELADAHHAGGHVPVSVPALRLPDADDQDGGVQRACLRMLAAMNFMLIRIPRAGGRPKMACSAC
jgi:hypothetical protein